MKNIRYKCGYSRQFVANKLGLCPDYFTQIESGRGAMPMWRAKQLAILYNCEPNEIMRIWSDLNEKRREKS